VSRATREGQYLFVNRRPVENRGLNYALIEGYHTALMKGRYPVCSLFLEIDPAAVDVNIHPAKREVKFHREFEIRKLVARAVQETLLAFHAEPAKSTSGFSAEPRDRALELEQTEIIPSEIAPEVSTPALPRFPETLKPAAEPQTIPAQQTPLKMGFAPSLLATVETKIPSSIFHPPSLPSDIAPPAFDPRPSTNPMPLLSVPLRLVGVIGRLYVVLESDRGLVLLDQHAAHERILF